MAGITLSIIACRLAQAQVEKDARAQFNIATRKVADALLARLLSYENLLRALQSMFLASDSVTREEFSLFLEKMQLPSHYPGIYSVTYAVRVSGSDRQSFEAQVSRNTALHYPGAAFKIKPDGIRQEYLPLVLREPFKINDNVYGLDLMADEVRRKSAEIARDSGFPSATGPLFLLSEAGAGQIASSLRLALYRKNAKTGTLHQRRDAFIGMLNVTFAVSNLVESALQNAQDDDMQLRITDLGFRPSGNAAISRPGLLFDNKAYASQHPGGAMFVKTQTLLVGQQTWELAFAAPQRHFSLTLFNNLPLAILLGGLLFTGLVCGLIRMLFTAERRAIALATDMTRDLRMSEARLAESQRMTQELIEALPIPVFFKGTDGRYLGVNRAWEDFFGTSRKAFVGKTVHDLYPDNREVGNRLHAMDQELWNNPGRQVHETPIVTPDSRKHEAIYYKATYTRPDGTVGGLIGTIIDITERKQAEQRYQQIFDNAAVGITRVDLDGYLRNVNQKFCDMLGYSKDELIGKSVKDITHPEDYGQGARFRSQMSANQLQSTSGEKRFFHKNGHVVWVLRSISVTRDKDGHSGYLISVVEDITDRKLAEQRQNMEHVVTRVLAEASSLAEAGPRIIQTICETMEWNCGTCWELDTKSALVRCVAGWGPETPEMHEFLAFSLTRSFMPEAENNHGLVRRAFETGRPAWITDITMDKTLKRAAMVLKTGLHSFFGFPFVLGNEVLGAMEFFHRDVRQPDDTLLLITKSIGSQIAQFIQRKRAEESLQFAAVHDALTGLPTRVLFNERLTHAVAQARRHDRRLAVMFIDLDHFKMINDTLGHDAGDKLLKEVAQRLTSRLRAGDTVCRLGGDEFVVLADDIGTPAALSSLAEKLVAAIASGYMLSGREFHVTASIGISTYPDDGQDAPALLKNADTAMYRAKEQSRNAFQFYSPQLNAHIETRLTLESGLRHALERNELVLYYQPQINVSSGAITGMEALVRWQHPESGLLPPGQFIPIAEENGLIVPIGEWVLKTACAAQRKWIESGLQPVTMAVNLSLRQFASDNHVQDTIDTLRQYNIDLSRVKLEISESTVMNDPSRAIAIMRQLRDMGIRLAIDDFGAGNSTLAYLKLFPVDSLKIDRSFITDIPGAPPDMAIVSALITMSHSLQLKVIAKGVETKAQYDFLRARLCDEAQGCYFSKPVPENEAAALLTGKTEPKNPQ